MYRIASCPCCEAPITRTVPVVIAPFIRERAVGADVSTGALSNCPECGFCCYCDRYDESEVAAIYRGYRGESYLRQRRRHEPWYTRSINAAIGAPKEVARRNARLQAFLLSHGVFELSRSVLDWGGDRGQFIPEHFNERFVYDISGVETVSGVVALKREQVAASEFDLVILAHVLEHASDPVALLRDVLSTRTKLLYVEVPYEPLSLKSAHESSTYARWVSGLARSPFYPAVAFISVALRVKFGLMPPFAVLQQHEHLNYFTESTLAGLLRKLGCEIVATTAYGSSDGYEKADSLGVLARAPTG